MGSEKFHYFVVVGLFVLIFYMQKTMKNIILLRIFYFTALWPHVKSNLFSLLESFSYAQCSDNTDLQ